MFISNGANNRSFNCFGRIKCTPIAVIILQISTAATDIFLSLKGFMQRKIKFKRNERGQIVEALTTGVLGLIFISKITYEYDEHGELLSETTWKDAKTIASVTHKKSRVPELVS